MEWRVVITCHATNVQIWIKYNNRVYFIYIFYHYIILCVNCCVSWIHHVHFLPCGWVLFWLLWLLLLFSVYSTVTWIIWTLTPPRMCSWEDVEHDNWIIFKIRSLRSPSIQQCWNRLVIIMCCFPLLLSSLLVVVSWIQASNTYW